MIHLDHKLWFLNKGLLRIIQPPPSWAHVTRGLFCFSLVESSLIVYTDGTRYLRKVRGHEKAWSRSILKQFLRGWRSSLRHLGLPRRRLLACVFDAAGLIISQVSSINSWLTQHERPATDNDLFWKIPAPLTNESLILLSFRLINQTKGGLVLAWKLLIVFLFIASVGTALFGFIFSLQQLK